MGIGDRIKQRRNELNMTQQELADAMGYKSKSTINKIELGKNNVSQSKVKEFAVVLKTTPRFLMDWGEDDNNELELTDNEKNLINKYRKLNGNEKKLVDGLIDQFVKEK